MKTNNMKNIIFLTFFLIITSIKSQTQRFIYDVEYKKDSTSTLKTKENYHLDIDTKEIKYYARDFFIADSLINNNIPFPKDMKLNSSNIIIHKLGSYDYDEYDLIENTVLNLHTRESQNWNLINEKKKVKNITLQKATTQWGGRNWIAWFSVDIPFQEGPYKFQGLPGLIIELEDDKHNYRFSLVKSENIKTNVINQFIEMARQIAVSVSLEKYKSTKLAYYESPINFIRNSAGITNSNEQFFLNDGTKVNQSNMREINSRLRESLKKYNNPINKNEKIIFPDK